MLRADIASTSASSAGPSLATSASTMPVHVLGVDHPEHRAHDVLAHLARTVGDRLVEQRQRVADRAVRGAGDQHERGFVEAHPFGPEDRRQSPR
jgi:hypothetical protein